MFALSAHAESTRRSFAIVVDDVTYSACKQAIDSYCEAVQRDGLNAFVASSDWATPEVVKDSLQRWYKSRSLEGAVFVGDIPIPMLRKAQFLTSAFKMNEEQFAWRDNSVPSDRYYDDFDLDFKFIQRDSLERNFFYYELTSKGAQSIHSDIYTARIIPSDTWGDKYQELNDYFKKVVDIKAERDNVINRVTSYTGEGSFSNSMIAWVDETQTLKEQCPDAFKDRDGSRFFVFHQQPLMKDMLLKAACEDDSDIYLFHCHGTPDRQWIGGFLTAENFEDPNFEPQNYDEYYGALYKSEVELAKYSAREQYRRLLRYGNTKESAVAKMYENYGIDSTWFVDATLPEVEKRDSTLETLGSILLEDVQKYDTDSRFVLFDACYNGDFREKDNIATRYIMGKGKTVVTTGNSVNVLQDKLAQPLMGMLAAGYRVGEWQKQINILESHIIGDPTFHFASSYRFDNPDLSVEDVKYWKKVLKSDYPADIKGLALQKLHILGAEDAIEVIYNTFCSSDSYNLRLQAMLLSLHYDNPLGTKILVRGLHDPYEFIRRKSAYYLSKRGDEGTIRDLVDAYFLDYNAKRVQFNISSQIAMFEGESFKECFLSELEKRDFIYDKESFKESSLKWLNSAYSLRDYMVKPLKEVDAPAKKRRSPISSLRNFPIPHHYTDVLGVVVDKGQDVSIRVQCAEVLTWYIYAQERGNIIKDIESALPQIEDEQVAETLTKSLKHLKEYTR